MAPALSLAQTALPSDTQGASTQSGGAATTASTSQAAGAPQSAGQQPGMMGMLMPFLLMFGVVYFLMIRPQQKRAKEHQSMLGGLKHGDDIVTSSGILGKVSGLSEKVATVEIADNVKIKILKSQISQIVRDQIKEIS